MKYLEIINKGDLFKENDYKEKQVKESVSFLYAWNVISLLPLYPSSQVTLNYVLDLSSNISSDLI